MASIPHPKEDRPMSMIESLSAVTLVTGNMAVAVRFYTALGFEMLYGGESADFTSYRAGSSYLNLGYRPDTGRNEGWGRAIFYVADVDAMYERALASGYAPEFEPRDATWGERYFHLRDPDGHELSFARPLSGPG
jgi:catechol 2,3-dioxygenase-like lactoylglutathione lyase family enzyme